MTRTCAGALIALSLAACATDPPSPESAPADTPPTTPSPPTITLEGPRSGPPATATPKSNLDTMLDEIESAAKIETAPPTGLLEVFPGIRVDADTGVVELDGIVPIDTRNERAPDVYLEVIVCTPNSKEHEALVMADVRPAELHAAMLLAGAEPGAPTRWEASPSGVRPVPAHGGRVRVELIARGRSPARPSAWIRSDESGAAFPSAGWVFAGSRTLDRDGDGVEEYEADRTGLLVGLHGFGSELIAWTHPAHPDADIEPPAWLANNTAVPPRGTPVTVRITRE